MEYTLDYKSNLMKFSLEADVVGRVFVKHHGGRVLYSRIPRNIRGDAWLSKVAKDIIREAEKIKLELNEIEREEDVPFDGVLSNSSNHHSGD